ncbi:MAG: stage III sporulation protein AD [Lachnospiraceae bacterium]|nr:stage III sporulation protein AD [Lachnospiraceae bacterium]
MEIVKIGLLGLVSVGIALMIKQTRPEYAYLFMVCAGLFVFYLCFDTFMAVADMTKQIGESVGNYDKYIQLLLKIIGISYISEFCSGMCQDAGYQTLGKQIETAGKFCVLLTGLPVFFTLIDTIREYF